MTSEEPLFRSRKNLPGDRSTDLTETQDNGKSELVFLGTGSSTGIPVITCDCEVCTSRDPRDNRTRVSVFLRNSRDSILIDCSPDFRIQALRNRIKKLDAILLTHSHNDHIGGLDEVRIFNFLQKASIPVYGDEATLADIRSRFAYVFEETQPGGGKPQLELIPIQPYVEFRIGSFHFLPMPIAHGKIQIMSYLINENTAYITDCSSIPEETEKRILNVKNLIIDAVRSKPHPTHLSFSEAVQWIRKIKPSKAYFTHINHDMSHQELTERYSSDAIIPHDNMVIPVDPR